VLLLVTIHIPIKKENTTNMYCPFLGDSYFYFVNFLALMYIGYTNLTEIYSIAVFMFS